MEQKMTKNIAFFDSEFTSNSLKDRGIQELIQCALIVCTLSYDEEHNPTEISKPIKEYKTFVKTNYNKELSEYIQSLTGITNEEVKNGTPFVEVMGILKQIIDEYDVKTIVVWGPDQMLLRRNCALNGLKRTHMQRVLNKFKDVSEKISKSRGAKCTISQKQVCEELKIEMDGNAHDAYYDALNLSKMISKLLKNKRIKQTLV